MQEELMAVPFPVNRAALVVTEIAESLAPKETRDCVVRGAPWVLRALMEPR